MRRGWALATLGAVLLVGALTVTLIDEEDSAPDRAGPPMPIPVEEQETRAFLGGFIWRLCVIAAIGACAIWALSEDSFSGAGFDGAIDVYVSQAAMRVELVVRPDDRNGVRIEEQINIQLRSDAATNADVYIVFRGEARPRNARAVAASSKSEVVSLATDEEAFALRSVLVPSVPWDSGPLRLQRSLADVSGSRRYVTLPQFGDPGPTRKLNHRFPTDAYVPHELTVTVAGPALRRTERAEFFAPDAVIDTSGTPTWVLSFGPDLERGQRPVAPRLVTTDFGKEDTAERRLVGMGALFGVLLAEAVVWFRGVRLRHLWKLLQK